MSLAKYGPVPHQDPSTITLDTPTYIHKLRLQLARQTPSCTILPRAATSPAHPEVPFAIRRIVHQFSHNLSAKDPSPTTPTPTMVFGKPIMDKMRGKKPEPENKVPQGVDIDQDVEDVKNQLPPLPSPRPTPHKDFLHCVPPNAPTYRKFSVFTAGSIEMGSAVQWQKHMVTMLSHLPITVCNPRRGHWNPHITPQARDKDFKEQVEWELSALEQVDVICFFFDVTTKSPVSLLELGLWAGSGKVVVCCGDGYWKGGNVELTCERYDIPFVKSFAELVPAVEKMLVEKGMAIDAKGDLVGENVHVEKEKPKKKAQLEAEKEDLQKRIDALQAQLAESKL